MKKAKITIVGVQSDGNESYRNEHACEGMYVLNEDLHELSYLVEEDGMPIDYHLHFNRDGLKMLRSSTALRTEMHLKPDMETQVRIDLAGANEPLIMQTKMHHYSCAVTEEQIEISAKYAFFDANGSVDHELSVRAEFV